jgi:hypothetical protein
MRHASDRRINRHNDHALSVGAVLLMHGISPADMPTGRGAHRQEATK